jgi:predicted NUDIX family phosphoesterase
MSGPNTSRVLVVPTAEFESRGYFQGFSPDAARYLHHLLTPSFAEFRPRSEVEEDPSYKQIIPYVIFLCGNQIFRYTRGSSQGETRLHRLRSIGVGGHVDEADADGRATFEAYEIALKRELDEEVAIGSPGKLRLIGLINDDQTPVGRVHLGAVHLYELESPLVTPCEEGLAEAGFISLDELLACPEELESWSRISLEALSGFLNA